MMVSIDTVMMMKATSHRLIAAGCSLPFQETVAFSTKLDEAGVRWAENKAFRGWYQVVHWWCTGCFQQTQIQPIGVLWRP